MCPHHIYPWGDLRTPLNLIVIIGWVASKKVDQLFPAWGAGTGIDIVSDMRAS